MAYATLDDLLARGLTERELIQLTNRDVGEPVEINAAILDRALQDASDQIDGYLGAYPLPLETVPPRVVALCCDLAHALLQPAAVIRKDEGMPEWKQRQIDAIATLEAIRDNDIDLGLPTQAPRAATVRVSGNARVFSRRRLGWM